MNLALEGLGAVRIRHTNQAPSCIGHVVEANTHGDFVSLRITHDEVAAAYKGTSQTAIAHSWVLALHLLAMVIEL